MVLPEARLMGCQIRPRRIICAFFHSVRTDNTEDVTAARTILKILDTIEWAPFPENC